MYDITARDTFDSLASWINELDTFAGTGPASREVVRMIVGNKVDKVRSRCPLWVVLERRARLALSAVERTERGFDMPTSSTLT